MHTQRVLDGAERGAHRGAAGAGRRGHPDEGGRWRRAASRHQGRQRVQEGPQGPHRAGRLVLNLHAFLFLFRELVGSEVQGERERES
jgi:hypothetical protein